MAPMDTLANALCEFSKRHGIPSSKRSIVCSQAFADYVGIPRDLKRTATLCSWPVSIDKRHRWYGEAHEQFHLRVIR